MQGFLSPVDNQIKHATEMRIVGVVLLFLCIGEVSTIGECVLLV